MQPDLWLIRLRTSLARPIGPRHRGAVSVESTAPESTVTDTAGDAQSPRHSLAQQRRERRPSRTDADQPQRIRRSRRTRPANPGERWARIVGLSSIGLISVAVILSACRTIPTRAGTFLAEMQHQISREAVTIPAEGPLDRELPQTTMIMARDGSVLAEINDVRFGQRLVVPLSGLAPDLIAATVAAEDRRFFNHGGVDPVGFMRAVMQNATSDSVASGASTLEMQLVRNLFLPDERAEQTVSRKLREAIAAYQLDERVTKTKVLETYLNSVYYGNQAYGAEAAAQRYFAKSAQQLSLPEAAMLAGLPQSPSAYDPLAHFDRAKKRQEHVLDLMAQAEMITPGQARAARAAPLELREPEPPEPRFFHWVNYITDVARVRFGPDALFTGGLRLRTTIDPIIQDLAEDVVARNEGIRQQAHANNSAMVVIDPATGEILAMVGSKDFWDQTVAGQVNVAVAGRQPGSSIKPIVFLAGFEQGLNPANVVWDRRTPFSTPPPQPPYIPANFDDRYYGLVTLRDALGNSLNVPAVKVLKYTGVPAMIDLARRLGITTLEDWDPRWLSLTLGGGEVRLDQLTGAYATISRLGAHKPVEPFLGVETSRGELLYAGPSDRPGAHVVDPRVAYQLLHVMGDAGARQVTFGRQSPLNLARPHMLKTGTTDDFRDTWTVGCLPQVCVGVWMGNTNNEPMVRVTSSLTAGKLWLDMIEALIERYHYPPIPFDRPDGVQIVRVPNVGGTRSGSADHEEVFLPGRAARFLIEMDWMAPD